MTLPRLLGGLAGRVQAQRDAPDLPGQLARFRAAHSVRRLDVGGVTWSYLVGGSGSRTVLYLPGGIGRAEAAFPYLIALEGDHQVVAVDYPQLSSVDALVNGLLAILDVEGIQRADVWGTSFGGMAAQVLARRVPERVSSLVLSNTAVPDPGRARRADRQAAVAALPVPVIRWLLRLSVNRLLRPLPRTQPGFWVSYLRPSLSAGGKGRMVSLSRMAADFYRLTFHPNDLAGWHGRVLLLSATDDELYRSMRRPLLRLYPGAEQVTVPGGHAATIGRESTYLDAVRRFLGGPLPADST
jgi:pimeloyl-ACP methyl ester carboxylesterase